MQFTEPQLRPVFFGDTKYGLPFYGAIVSACGPIRDLLQIANKRSQDLSSCDPIMALTDDIMLYRLCGAVV